MEQERISSLMDKAKSYGLDLREDEILFLVGFLETQAKTGLVEIEKQISEIDVDTLCSN